MAPGIGFNVLLMWSNSSCPVPSSMLTRPWLSGNGAHSFPSYHIIWLHWALIWTQGYPHILVHPILYLIDDAMLMLVCQVLERVQVSYLAPISPNCRRQTSFIWVTQFTSSAMCSMTSSNQILTVDYFTSVLDHVGCGIVHQFTMGHDHYLYHSWNGFGDWLVSTSQCNCFPNHDWDSQASFIRLS